MKNRYGIEYWFKKENNDTYTIQGNLNHWRFGAKEGVESNGFDDFGFADPSGGPFISIGYEIDKRKVKRIYIKDNELYFEVE